MERRYTVQPSPHKELTPEEKSLIARMEINLQALFSGENPFKSDAVAPMPDEEEIDAKDVPF